MPDQAPLKSAPVRLRRDVASDAVDEVDDGVGGIHPETLFAHLMKLGQDEVTHVYDSLLMTQHKSYKPCINQSHTHGVLSLRCWDVSPVLQFSL